MRTCVRYDVRMSDVLVCKLMEVLDALAAEEIAGLSQRDVVVALDRCRSRLDRECSRRLREVDRNAEHTVVGCKTAAAFLRSRSRVRRGDAYRRVRVAREMESLAATDSAWACGAVTTGHVEVIADARHAARADEQFAEFEATLVKIASRLPPEDLADAVAAWRDALDNDLDRDGSLTRAGEQHDVRKASFAKSIHGIGFLEATFGGEGSEIADRAIKRAYERGHCQADPRTPLQQRADALVEIFSAYLGGLPRTGNLPHLLVITDEATLAGEAVGWAHTAEGTRLAPATVRRIACNAFIQDVLLGGDGVPLALGRAERLFTPDQYRAMVVRDGGCRGPTCDATPDRCEAHHLDGWAAEHGRTDLERGALLCRGSCHDALHDGTMRVVGNANGRLDFYDRDGQLIGTTQPRTAPTRLRTKYGRQCRAEELAIHRRIDELAQSA
jgi:hypothetical protein